MRRHGRAWRRARRAGARAWIAPSCVPRLSRMTSRNICGPPRPDAPVPPSPVRAGATSASSTVAAGRYARSFAAMSTSSPCRRNAFL